MGYYTFAVKNDPFLEKHFNKFRKNIVGVNQTFATPFGKQTIHYFDWTASGRLYGPIEEKISNTFGAFVGNTHSESTETGMDMTIAYHEARKIIKNHVNAGDNDVILMVGSGTTAAISKLQRILGLKYEDQLNRFKTLSKNKLINLKIPKNLIPVVFISHMEHHSNQISWLEGGADVVIVPTNSDGVTDFKSLENLLKKYKSRKIKIGSFSACSNVTGILNPIHILAKTMHEYGGYCFVDFAAAAPYIKIDMNPKNKNERLDALFFSPHKFLGGPGTSGVLVFNKNLYPVNLAPENPGGGTVNWTNPWGGRSYCQDIEVREDGGTPAFLQTIKAALAIKLKEEMGISNISKREERLLKLLVSGLVQVPNLEILGKLKAHRLGIVSFYIKDIHYNLIVKLLNDRYGIQTRGGCSCAGSYGHFLLGVDKTESKKITDRIDKGDFSTKPGWVRVSLHPTTTESEIKFLIKALNEIAANIKGWQKDYSYSAKTNEFSHKKSSILTKEKQIGSWFRE